MPERRRPGTGGNITRSGLTAHWAMRRRKSSAPPVTGEKLTNPARNLHIRGTDPQNVAIFDPEDDSTAGGWIGHDSDRWRTNSSLARGEVRGVMPNLKCSVVKLGGDGTARRLSLVSTALWVEPSPISRCRPPRVTNRMTRSSRRSPREELLADSRSGPGASASPLIKEPARFNRTARRLVVEGWVSTSLPLTPDVAHFASNTRTGR